MFPTSVKATVLELVQNLPDDVSYEDILYMLHSRHKIEEGLRQVEAGETLTDQEVRQKLQRWLG